MSNAAADKFLVVINARQERHVALARGMVSAGLRDTPPHIHLFISSDDTEGDILFPEETLKAMLKEMDDKNITYDYEFCWTDNIETAALAAAKRHKATMVLYPFDESAARRHRGFTLAKWEMLRSSDCPVILVKPVYGQYRKKILAAVNYQSVYPEYTELNKRILERAKWLAEKHNAELFVVNAYEDMDDYPDFDRIQRASGLSHDHIKLVEGSPERVVSKTAQDVGADLVLIGTRNSQDDLASKFRRNTAEKVSTLTKADIMVLN